MGGVDRADEWCVEPADLGDSTMSGNAANRYELVVPVELPEGMTPEAFLRQTMVEWGDGGHFNTRNMAAVTLGPPGFPNMPRFTGPKEMRRVYS